MSRTAKASPGLRMACLQARSRSYQNEVVRGWALRQPRTISLIVSSSMASTFGPPMTRNAPTPP